MKEIVTREFVLGPSRGRMKVVRISKDVVSIQEEYNRGDCFGWEREKHFKVCREEIAAAASLLGITSTLF